MLSGLHCMKPKGQPVREFDEIEVMDAVQFFEGMPGPACRQC